MMENDTITKIRLNVENFQKLLSQKEEILKKYNEWQSLYQDAQKILVDAKDAYEKNKISEDVYQSWIKENADYLAIVCEYSQKFEEINKELEVYDANAIEEQAEFLANMTKFVMISEKMKNIQKYSKKKVNKSFSTDFVECENAEGRNKKIYRPLAEDYNALVVQKRELSKILKKQQNLVFNKIEIEESAIDNHKLNADPKHEYDALSIEDKIKKIEEKMKFFRTAPGIRQEVLYCGEIITLPSDYVNAYIICDSELKKLQKGLNDSEPKPDIFYEALDYVKKEENFEDIYSDSSSQLINKSADEIVDEVFKGFTPDVFHQSNEVNQNLVPSYEEEEFDRENEELFAMVNKHHDDYVASLENNKKSKKDTKPCGFMKILKIKKPKKIENLKEKIKKAACLVAAGAILLAYSSPIFINMFNKNNNTNINDIPEDQIVSEITEEEQEELDKVTDNIIAEDSSTTATQVEDEFIKLGDKFNVKNNSKIYNTMYDATLNRDGLRPYFGTEYERTIGGLAINYEGELYFFYSTDANAQENIDMLIANGGKITSVLSQNASGYEGFYNIEDVNSLNNTLGGMNR